MTDKNAFLKITLLYLYLYFVGPLIWGVWMVKSLKIITAQEFVHCLFSPVSISIFVLLFLLNLMHTGYTVESLSDNGKGIRSILKVHCISIVVFGILGTPLFLSGLSRENMDQTHIAVNSWIIKAAIGSISGIALIFMFYVLFSVMLFDNLKHFFKAEDIRDSIVILKKFNAVLYCLGLLSFLISATLAYLVRIQKTGAKAEIGDILFYFTFTAVPVLMSLLLYKKSLKRIRIVLAECETINSFGTSESEKKILQRIKKCLRISMLILFLVLLCTGRIKMWIFLLIMGFALNLISGRVYCGWICPVHTVDSIVRKSRIKKRIIPAVFRKKYMRFAWLFLLLAIFTILYVSPVKLSVFVVITFLGMLVSVIFALALWCRYLCPWAAVFRTLDRILIRTENAQEKNA